MLNVSSTIKQQEHKPVSSLDEFLYDSFKVFWQAVCGWVGAVFWLLHVLIGSLRQAGERLQPTWAPTHVT